MVPSMIIEILLALLISTGIITKVMLAGITTDLSVAEELADFTAF
jgi:hypothetical protein